MLKLDPFVFSTNSFPGNDMIPALDMGKRFGFHYVELPAIDGISEQINVDDDLTETIARAKNALAERGLECYAVSGHCDMTDGHQFSRLLKKIEFAGKIGAKVLNTRCGPKQNYAIFEKNVRKAAELAASFDVMLNLESYGDIVGPARESGSVFKALALENVFYNYDPGNTFRFARGSIVIEEDIRNNTAPLRYLHLKDALISDGIIKNTPIGQGDLDFPAIFKELERISDSIPCSLEVPMSFYVQMEDLKIMPRQTDAEEAEKTVAESIEFINKHAELHW